MRGKIQNFGLAEYVLVALLGGFVALKMIFSLPRFSDGNAYMYMAKLIASGAIPYRDFFLASPPLVVYFFALFGRVFGFSWRAFNYLPVLFSAIDGLVIYVLFKRVFGRLASLAAVAVYLFSFAVLATSDFYTGIHLALTLALLGTLAMVRRWPLLGGALFGLAVLAKLYVVITFVAVLAYFLLRRKWADGLKSAMGFLVVAGLVSVVFWWLAGQQFLDGVLVNHLRKVEGIPKGRIFKFFAWHDWWLLLGLPLMFYWRRWVPGVIALPVVFWGVFLAFFPDVYYMYFKLLVVWLALWWGWNVAQAGRRWPGVKTGVVVALLLVAVAATGGWQYYRQQARAAAVTDLDGMVESVSRLVGEGKPIYGDYSLVPLLALEADRPVFNNYIDNNPMYFNVGVFDYEKRAAEIKEAKVGTIITKVVVDENGQLLTGPEQVLPPQFYIDYCRPARGFPLEKDYSHNAVIIWQCEYEQLVN